MTIRWQGPGPDPATPEWPLSGDRTMASIVLRRSGPESPRHPVLSFGMDVLGGDKSHPDLITHLKTSLDPQTRRVETKDCALVLSQTSEHLFGVLHPNPGLDIQTATHSAYEAILNTSRNLGKPHLLRLWNFFPRITELENGEERYRLFNSGRRRALAEASYLDSHGAPAACAVGSHRGGLNIAFLAAKRACIPIENPRQVSAYDYPNDYGANPPVFARAIWHPQMGAQGILFLSGTASIVGHRSLHPGDVGAQTHETLRNIRAVLQQAERHAGGVGCAMSQLQGQVFVRHPADQPVIEAILHQHEMRNFTYLHADICRPELLVEIEAHAHI